MGKKNSLKHLIRNLYCISLPFLLALFVGFAGICPASAGVNPAYDIAITKAASGIENSEYAEAVRVLQEILQAKPDDEMATLYMGVALSRMSDRRAEEYLKKSLRMNPKNPRVNLELGIYYYNKSQLEESRDYFENTISLAPNTEYAGKSREYLSLMQKKVVRKPWSLNISVGGQYDNNVVLDSGDTPLPEGISGKSDWSGVLYLNGRYHFVTGQKTDISAGYRFYQNLHMHLSEFNVMDNLFDLSAVFLLSKVLSIKAAYSFDYVLVGGDSYDTAHSLSPSLVISEGKGFSTVIEYRYRNTHFMNSNLFVDNSDRSGSNHMVGITQNVPLGSIALLRLGYEYDTDSTREDFWDYDGHKGSAGMQIILPAGFSIDLSGEYYWKDYEDNDPSVSDKTREDETGTAAISMTKTLSDIFSVTIGQLYMNNQSNIDAYDYERAITSLFINARF